MTMREDEVGRNPRNDSPHRHILTKLMRRYDMPLMNNVYRADYVEGLVAVTLGTEWWLTWMHEWDWAAWDCQHKSGARLEVKQSSARQSWDSETISKERHPRFDIAPRTGFYTEDGSRWVKSFGRPADLYVFAWHGERRKVCADHRDANQWQFYVVAEQTLPEKQKSIGLPGLEAIVSPCRIVDLASAVKNTCPAPRGLKAAVEHVQ